MTHTKTVKSAPFDSRSSLSLTYLDEYPDIDLIQQGPADEPESSDGKTKVGKLPPIPIIDRRHVLSH